MLFGSAARLRILAKFRLPHGSSFLKPTSARTTHRMDLIALMKRRPALPKEGSPPWVVDTVEMLGQFGAAAAVTIISTSTSGAPISA